MRRNAGWRNRRQTGDCAGWVPFLLEGNMWGYRIASAVLCSLVLAKGQFDKRDFRYIQIRSAQIKDWLEFRRVLFRSLGSVSFGGEYVGIPNCFGGALLTCAGQGAVRQTRLPLYPDQKRAD